MANLIRHAEPELTKKTLPQLLVLNQMAGPMTWELVVDLAQKIPALALLTGHPDTLDKVAPPNVQVTPATPYKRGGFITRSFSWARYMIQAFFWLWKWPAKTPILVFSNPPMGLWVAALMRMIRGTRYAVMVHDIYPDVAVRMGVVGERNLLVRLWSWINRIAYERAEAVMTLGENMSAILDPQFDKSKTTSGTIDVIYPWADTTTFRPIKKTENPFAQKHDQVEKITVMYSGNMGLGHDLETMVEAAERLQHESRLHFLFVGSGPKWPIIETAIDEKQLTNATLLPWQDESVIPYSLATADIAFVSLEPEMAALAIPSKAFYFLAAGAPLFVLSPQNTELASIIRDFECGWVREPGDVDHLVEVLQSACRETIDLANYQEASRHAATSIGDRRKNSAKLYDCLVQLELVERTAGVTAATESVAGSEN